MRQSEDLPMDPDVLAELEAIDATLAGRLVDPEFAELAELTVLVAAERSQITPERARSIDERVIHRFGPAAPRQRGSHHRRWGWQAQWGAGLAALAAALVALVVVVHPGGSSSSNSLNLAKAVSGTAHRGATSSGSSASSSANAKTAGPLFRSAPHAAQGKTIAGSLNGSASSSSAASAPSTGSLTPAPATTARQTIQSAQLQLSASSRWVDVVAQEVFNVIGQEKGIVRNSEVTAATGNGGYATFNLSIPSANLGDTVTRLSALQHSHVTSRTDGTQDVNSQYLSDQRRLGDATALRTSLLKQLAGAVTQARTTSLRAQIHDAEASISSDQSTLHRLQNQISFSQLYVTINGGPIVEPLAATSHSSGGFTIGRAAHDAGRVLTVAAGVALITLAALVPVGLLVALAAWVTLWVRRRRREQALDVA
jgi:hypothetical protein